MARVAGLSGRACGAHWNGVCAFGMKFDVLTRTRARPPWYLRPISRTCCASVTMPSMSSCVSVGWPTMKYILTLVQPWLNAFSAAAYRSSSVTILLIVMRRRSVPASGAKVMLCLPRVATASATRTEKLSTRIDGSEIVSLVAELLAQAIDDRQIREWSVVLSETSESSS